MNTYYKYKKDLYYINIKDIEKLYEIFSINSENDIDKFLEEIIKTQEKETKINFIEDINSKERNVLYYEENSVDEVKTIIEDYLRNKKIKEEQYENNPSPEKKEPLIELIESLKDEQINQQVLKDGLTEIQETIASTSHSINPETNEITVTIETNMEIYEENVSLGETINYSTTNASNEELQMAKMIKENAFFKELMKDGTKVEVIKGNIPGTKYPNAFLIHMNNEDIIVRREDAEFYLNKYKENTKSTEKQSSARVFNPNNENEKTFEEELLKTLQETKCSEEIFITNTANLKIISKEEGRKNSEEKIINIYKDKNNENIINIKFSQNGKDYKGSFTLDDDGNLTGSIYQGKFVKDENGELTGQISQGKFVLNTENFTINELIAYIQNDFENAPNKEIENQELATIKANQMHEELKNKLNDKTISNLKAKACNDYLKGETHYEFSYKENDKEQFITISPETITKDLEMQKEKILDQTKEFSKEIELTPEKIGNYLQEQGFESKQIKNSTFITTDYLEVVINPKKDKFNFYISDENGYVKDYNIKTIEDLENTLNNLKEIQKEKEKIKEQELTPEKIRNYFKEQGFDFSRTEEIEQDMKERGIERNSSKETHVKTGDYTINVRKTPEAFEFEVFEEGRFKGKTIIKTIEDLENAFNNVKEMQKEKESIKERELTPEKIRNYFKKQGFDFSQDEKIENLLKEKGIKTNIDDVYIETGDFSIHVKKPGTVFEFEIYEEDKFKEKTKIRTIEDLENAFNNVKEMQKEKKEKKEQIKEQSLTLEKIENYFEKQGFDFSEIKEVEKYLKETGFESGRDYVYIETGNYNINVRKSANAFDFEVFGEKEGFISKTKITTIEGLDNAFNEFKEMQKEKEQEAIKEQKLTLEDFKEHLKSKGLNPIEVSNNCIDVYTERFNLTLRKENDSFDLQILDKETEISKYVKIETIEDLDNAIRNINEIQKMQEKIKEQELTPEKIRNYFKEQGFDFSITETIEQEWARRGMENPSAKETHVETGDYTIHVRKDVNSFEFEVFGNKEGFKGKTMIRTIEDLNNAFNNVKEMQKEKEMQKTKEQELTLQDLSDTLKRKGFKLEINTEQNTIDIDTSKINGKKYNGEFIIENNSINGTIGTFEGGYKTIINLNNVNLKTLKEDLETKGFKDIEKNIEELKDTKFVLN